MERLFKEAYGSGSVILEPTLDVVMGPAFEKKSTTTEMGARPDILARGVPEIRRTATSMS